MTGTTTLSDVKDKLKLILFDLDGTLVDSSRPMAEAFNHALSEFNIEPYSQQKSDALIGIPLAKIFMEILNRPTRDEVIEKCIDIYRKKYLDICCEQSFLYDGVADIIPELAKKYHVTLATTKKSDVATMTLEYFGLLDNFKLVYGFDTVSEPKPSPEIILKTLETLDVQPGEAMMIGDSLFDLNAGKSAGVITCSVTYGFEKEPILKVNDPDIIIDNFLEFRELL